MIDLSTSEVDKRIEQRAALATPRSASEQVATLLGVEPQDDQGQPVALALNAEIAPVAMAAAEPVETVVPGPTLAPAATVAVATPAATPSFASRVEIGRAHV